jgi:hypothetical protein
MSTRKAWWKKITLRGVVSSLAKVASFAVGGLAASEAPQPGVVVVQGPTGTGFDMTTLLMIGAGLLLLLFLVIRR